MTRSIRALTTFVAAAALLSLAADWPQFRGLKRDGVSAETGLLRQWPATGPKQAWRRPIGEGYSGMAVAGNRLYTMYAGEQEGKPTEFAVALDAATGAEIWRTAIGDKYDTQFGNGPRSTPTVEGDRVYVLASKGAVAALSAKDGAVAWKLELTQALGSKVPTWGFTGSVIVDAGKVLLEGGGPEGKSFVAIDAKSGKVLWTSGNGPEEAGYNSPLAVDIAGKREYVHITGDKVRALDGEGKEVWSHPWPQGETHATPVFIPPNQIFTSGVEGIGATLLQVDGAAGGAKVKEVWKNPAFRTHFNASVFHDGYLYGFDNTTLKCISAKDGSLAWAKRGLGKGSLAIADGNLLVLSDDGRLLLVEAAPGAYVEKGNVQALSGRCWTPPTISGGRVFVRNHAEIVAYDLKG